LTNLAKAATGRILSKETRVKISMARKGIKLSYQTRTKLSAIGIMRSGISVEVIKRISGEIMLYPTLTLAALALGVSRTAVKKVMDCPKVLKKTYVIKLNKK
jgi:NUMOD3 motif